MTIPSPDVTTSTRARWNPAKLLEWALLEYKNAAYPLAQSAVTAVEDLSDLPGGPYIVRITGSNSFGHAELKKTLAEFYGATPEHILLAQGAAECNFLIAGAILRQGGTAIIEQPTYEPILRGAEMFADTVKRLPRRLENHCLPDPDELRELIDSSTKLISLTNLHNPTGVHMKPERVQELAQIADAAGAVLLVDEVFHPMVDWDYRKHAFSCGAISVSSMDKAFGLSDLRVGWAVASPEIVRHAYSFNNLLGVHQPFATEDLAAQILSSETAMEFFRKRADKAKHGREHFDKFLAQFPEARFIVPDGGINGILRLPAGCDDRKFIAALQQRKDTVAFPGSLFELPGTIRVSFGGDSAIIREGFKRLGELYREW
jgi:aspartate/methionine/tyrosine aminotransferase